MIKQKFFIRFIIDGSTSQILVLSRVRKEFDCKFLVQGVDLEFENEDERQKYLKDNKLQNLEVSEKETFIKENEPHINANISKGQMQIDIEGANAKSYFPLAYFKYDLQKLTIVKKSDEEIAEIVRQGEEKEKDRKEKEAIDQKQLEDAQKVLLKTNVSDKERISALQTILTLKKN